MRYTGMVLGFLLALTLSLGTLTYSVDPYRAFHLQDISTRSDLIYYLRLIKPQQLQRAAADLLILGSSRAAKLRPALITPSGSTGYNAALPGMTSYEMLAHLRHANAFTHTRQLIIGLDFSAYLDSNPRVRFGFVEARLAGSAAPLASRTLFALRDRQRLLLSGAAVADTLHVALGTQRRQMDFYHDGTWSMLPSPHAPSRQQKFIRIGLEYFKRAADASHAHELEHLREVVRYAHRHNIATRLFVSPVHMLTLAAYEKAGQIGHYLDWQRDVLALLQSEAETMGASAFPLYGLQTDAQASMESVNAPPPIPLYDDAVHYSFAYGDIILNELQREAPQRATVLTPETLSQYWAQTAQSLQTFREENTGLLAAFERAVQRQR